MIRERLSTHLQPRSVHLIEEARAAGYTGGLTQLSLAGHKSGPGQPGGDRPFETPPA